MKTQRRTMRSSEMVKQRRQIQEEEEKGRGSGGHASDEGGACEGMILHLFD